MPPHCDSLDGPVATAARHALEQDAVEVVLAYVPASAEEEVRSTFEAVLPVRRLGHEARLVAERLFLKRPWSGCIWRGGGRALHRAVDPQASTSAP